jgi:hypothetical protein
MSYSQFLSNMDFYGDEYRQFQRDVHLLILGTLEASIRYLDSQTRTELVKIEDVMKQPLDDEYQQHLVDEHVDVLSTNSDQERFVRNMALVALSSRLTHALRTMARSAQSFSKRKDRYAGKDEYKKLWREYTERFQINFGANAKRIKFVETMRRVRNQIVHEGAEANTAKPLDKIDLNSGDAGLVDMKFSKKYPEYVSGGGSTAEVNVSQEQLEEAIKRSAELVGWLAVELRKRELESIGKTGPT